MSLYVPSFQINCTVAAAVGHSVFCAFGEVLEVDDHPFVWSSSARRLTGRSVQEIFDCLGPAYFCRAYCMTYESFWVLCGKIGVLIRNFAAQGVCRQRGNRTGQIVGAVGTPPPMPNGSISSSARLGVTLVVAYVQGACV